MKNKMLLGSLGTFVISGAVSASVIYGLDHRIEVSEGSPMQHRLSTSTATMISMEHITPDPVQSNVYVLSQKTLRDWLETPSEEPKYKELFSPKIRMAQKNGYTFCEGERFVDQPSPGACSGFLIAPDLLVTAGHCSLVENFCSKFRWVFGFEFDVKTKTAGTNVSGENIYSCKKVISKALSVPLGLDYAIVQLDRRVVNRAPVTIENSQKIENDTSLFVIGSPSGLPLKVAAGANVRNNEHPYFFSANLDTFQGNSGSAVFNAVTGVVEGILVRGEEDFRVNQAKMCVEANKCEDYKCRGEDVTRLSTIPEIGLQRALNQAAESGDMKTLMSILKLKLWVDFYTQDGESALMKAVRAGKLEVLRTLISHGADVNLQDARGSSSVHFFVEGNSDKDEMVLRELLVSGAQLELKNSNGETPLLYASQFGNLKTLKLLVSLGASKDALNLQGETLLFLLARKNNVPAIKHFINLGVDTSRRNNQGKVYSDYLAKKMLSQN